MSAKKDVILGHADEADGIDEYDNALPGWWLFLFAFTIVWGIGYAVDYHFISHRSQAGAYDAEMAAAAERWPAQEATAVEVTPEAVAAGKAIFATNCVACHGGDLTGGIGPNLIDDEWIHGGELADIVKVITEGVPEKGMLTWGPILGDEKIGQVAAFVYSEGQGN